MNKSDELTMSEALRDPLIAIMMRADGVTSEDFKRLLETVARELEANFPDVINAGVKEQAMRTLAPHRWEDTRHVYRNGAKDD